VCAFLAVAAVAKVGSYGEFLNMGQLNKKALSETRKAGRNNAVRHSRGGINRTVWKIKLWMKRLSR
jgi:hypothetical protein